MSADVCAHLLTQMTELVAQKTAELESARTYGQSLLEALRAVLDDDDQDQARSMARAVLAETTGANV
jgi:hypothetical protein